MIIIIFFIGTGAVCIYPLLFAKMYGNQMIATEVDKTSIQTAIEHVKNNNLEDIIKGKLMTHCLSYKIYTSLYFLL